MSSEMLFKAPSNSGGFAVGNTVYKPDANGELMVHIEHVQHALNHGFKPLDSLGEAQVQPAVDPNINRAGGDVQHPVKPGKEPAAAISLTAEEEEKALAEAAATKGALLDLDEKTAVLVAALDAKVAAASATKKPRGKKAAADKAADKAEA